MNKILTEILDVQAEMILYNFKTVDNVASELLYLATSGLDLDVVECLQYIKAQLLDNDFIAQLNTAKKQA